MIAAIVAAEIAFWVLIALGLIARYPLGRKRLGLGLLAATPVVDAALLIAVAVDLARGGTAETPHALAAIYLGCSLAFGHDLIRWADVQFAYRFAGGPAPAPKPTTSAGRTRREREGFAKHALAWAIGCSIMGLAILLVGDASRTDAFASMAGLWTVVLVIDGLFALPQQEAEPGDAERAPR